LFFGKWIDSVRRAKQRGMGRIKMATVARTVVSLVHNAQLCLELGIPFVLRFGAIKRPRKPGLSINDDA
jgi:hypothetical protein